MKIIETNNPRERIIEVDSEREGIDLLHAFNNRTEAFRRAEWAMLMRDGDKLIVYERFNQPCLGEMRTYGKVNVPTVTGILSAEYSQFTKSAKEEQRECTRPDDPRPGDLWTPFPKTGNPIAVCVPFYTRDQKNYPSDNTHYEIMCGEHSPYASVLKSFEFSKRDNIINGIVVTDTNVDSTILVSFFRHIRSHAPKKMTERLLGVLGDELKHLYPAFYLSGFTFSFATKVDPNNKYNTIEDKDYMSIPQRIDLSRLANFVNKALRTDLTGGTFHDRYAYNRPMIDYVWGDFSNHKIIELYTLPKNVYSKKIPIIEVTDILDVILTALNNESTKHDIAA